MSRVLAHQSDHAESDAERALAGVACAQVKGRVHFQVRC